MQSMTIHLRKIMVLYKKRYFVYVTVFIFTFSSWKCFSQKSAHDIELYEDTINKLIEKRNVNDALKLLNRVSKISTNENFRYSIIHKNYFYCYYLKAKYDSCQTIVEKINSYKQYLNPENLNNFYLNKAYLFRKIYRLDSSVIYFTKSLHFFEKDTTINIVKRANIYQGLASIYSQTKNFKKELFYLNNYLNEAKKSNNSYKIGVALNNLGVFHDKMKNPEQALAYFKSSLQYKLREKNKNAVLQNIGSIYLSYYNNLDSAEYYNKQAINKSTTKLTLAYIHFDLATIAKRNKNLIKEKRELFLALKYIKEDSFEELELKIYKNLYENFKKSKNIQLALLYLENYDSLNSALKSKYLIDKVEEIETQYQVEKKEAQIKNLEHLSIIEKQKTKVQKSRLILLLAILILGIVIAYLILKNSRKKRLLAEQQKFLEQQKNLTLLKEQEIKIINAMINGQEKERKLIAEDLHDNIGSVLATLKLHFENLKLNRNKKHFNQKELYDKTEVLIDETYFKIRHLAHAKNSGVLEQQGLVLAITSLAEKISAANSLQVEVIEYGVSNELEISFEIMVFRIVQELLTNIIKHAAATKAAISLSQFDNNLSIIVEDNGIGFDQTTITTKKGMGVASIQKRITHLEGTFTVDSTVGKGTSVLIDIPL